jgi:hypothetical protein
MLGKQSYCFGFFSSRINLLDAEIAVVCLRGAFGGCYTGCFVLKYYV